MHYEYTTKQFDKSENIIKYLKEKNYIDYEYFKGKRGPYGASDKKQYQLELEKVVEKFLTNFER